MAFVHVEPRDDGVTVLRLDRPPANALSRALLEELADAARSLATDPPGAVVVTGSERIFAAGADIAEFGGPEEAAVVGGHFREALDLVARVPRPVIAAVNGYALGGGCELALACDLRVAADNATFGQPEILLGIIPGGGATQRLARLIGASRAKDLIFTGRQVQADEALRLGLVDRVVPRAEVLDEALTWAGALARGPSLALAMAKRAIDEGLESTLAAGLDVEHDLFTEVFRTDDAGAGVASFLEHGPGKATFRGK
jgi:enoyl-CoA hydratase/carnithine racemase